MLRAITLIVTFIILSNAGQFSKDKSSPPLGEEDFWNSLPELPVAGRPSNEYLPLEPQLDDEDISLQQSYQQEKYDALLYSDQIDYSLKDSQLSLDGQDFLQSDLYDQGFDSLSNGQLPVDVNPYPQSNTLQPKNDFYYPTDTGSGDLVSLDDLGPNQLQQIPLEVQTKTNSNNQNRAKNKINSRYNYSLQCKLYHQRNARQLYKEFELANKQNKVPFTKFMEYQVNNILTSLSNELHPHNFVLSLYKLSGEIADECKKKPPISVDILRKQLQRENQIGQTTLKKFMINYYLNEVFKLIDFPISASDKQIIQESKWYPIGPAYQLLNYVIKIYPDINMHCRFQE